MGIRFCCHQCGHELHVKDFQGGKRSKCPECDTRFRIPLETGVRSIPLDNTPNNSPDNSQRDGSAAGSVSTGTTSGAAMGTLAAESSVAKPSSGDCEPEVDSQTDVSEEIDSVGTASAGEQPAQPRAILEAPDATWFVRPPAGGQYGPAPGEIFCEWLIENRVTRDSLVWRDGWPQWLVAGDVFVDYFGPAVPLFLAPATPSPSPDLAAAMAPSGTLEFVAPLSLSDRALAARKRQRKKNYMIMIGILAAISIGLVIALVAVLMQNS